MAALDAEIAELEGIYANAAELADEAKFNAYQKTITLAASSAVNLLGRAAILSTGWGIVISVAVGEVLLLVKALRAPASIKPIDVADDLLTSRVGNVLDALGDDAYAVSTNSQKLVGPAARLGNHLLLAISAGQAAEAIGAAIDRSAEEKAFAATLADTRAELQKLNDINAAVALRENCMSVLAEDLTDALPVQDPVCPITLPDPD